MEDYNRNRLNYEIHQPTATFADMLYSYSFMPLINKPTRRTEHCPTLIDTIITNNCSNLQVSVESIMITDVSYFPIFQMNSKIVSDNMFAFIVRRTFSQQDIQDFALWYQMSIVIQSWNVMRHKVISLHSIDISQILLYLFPQQKKNKFKYNNRKPSLSDGLKVHQNKKWIVHEKHSSEVFL